MIREGGMAEENAIEMRVMMARWESLCARWALDDAEEASLLGGAAFAGPVGKAASWRASSMEQRMRLLVELGAALDALLGDDYRICVWLRRPRESMGGKCPIEVMGTSVEWIRSLHRAASDFVG